MKNGKSTTDIAAELIKHAPDEIHQGIADTFNMVAETGECTEEILSGIICPLEKSRSKQKLGLKENLRPIILLAVLRKILNIIHNNDG